MLMALYGLSYGMLLTNNMGVSQVNKLGKDEKMIFAGLQLLLEAIGSLTGPVITGKFCDIINKKNKIM